MIRWLWKLAPSGLQGHEQMPKNERSSIYSTQAGLSAMKRFTKSSTRGRCLVIHLSENERFSRCPFPQHASLGWFARSPTG